MSTLLQAFRGMPGWDAAQSIDSVSRQALAKLGFQCVSMQPEAWFKPGETSGIFYADLTKDQILGLCAHIYPNLYGKPAELVSQDSITTGQPPPCRFCGDTGKVLDSFGHCSACINGMKRTNGD